MVQAGELSLAQAQQIFLCGKIGFAGIPDPDSGFRLKRRLANPDFPDALMSRILEETNRIGAGQYLLLNCYPCYLWLPGQQPDQELRLQLDYPSDVEWRCWRWLDDQLPTLQWQRRETASKLTASLAMPAELTGKLIGYLVMIRASCLDPQTHWQTIELSALSSDTSTL